MSDPTLSNRRRDTTVLVRVEWETSPVKRTGRFLYGGGTWKRRVGSGVFP